MGGQPFSADVVNTAHYIIGDWQTLSNPEVASAIAAGSGLKLAIPLAQQNWLWAGVKQRSPEYYAQQAVRGVKQALEGEEVDFGQEINPGLIVMAVLGGLFALLLIAGGLIALVDNLI
jgi:hypothetical protein